MSARTDNTSELASDYHLLILDSIIMATVTTKILPLKLGYRFYGCPVLAAGEGRAFV
jgi:hypothetical protein